MYRQLALHLCDWDLSESALVDRLNRMAADGEPERAAAMALFNNKLSLTINILSGSHATGKTSAGVNTGEYILSSYNNTKA